MTGDKKMLEINQRREGGRYLPPRDTFLLSVQGDVISAEAMGEKEFAKCFNPSNLSLSIVGEKKEGGYVVYDQDYTKVHFSNSFGTARGTESVLQIFWCEFSSDFSSLIFSILLDQKTVPITTDWTIRANTDQTKLSITYQTNNKSAVRLSLL